MSNRALAATANQEWHFQNSQSRDLLLVFSSVGLVYLSLPGGPVPWLAWVAMVPLGVGLHGKSLRHAFMMTFSVALFRWLTATWWLVPSVALPPALRSISSWGSSYSSVCSTHYPMAWRGCSTADG